VKIDVPNLRCMSIGRAIVRDLAGFHMLYKSVGMCFFDLDWF